MKYVAPIIIDFDILNNKRLKPVTNDFNALA